MRWKEGFFISFVNFDWLAGIDVLFARGHVIVWTVYRESLRVTSGNFCDEKKVLICTFQDIKENIVKGYYELQYYLINIYTTSHFPILPFQICVLWKVLIPISYSPVWNLLSLKLLY